MSALNARLPYVKRVELLVAMLDETLLRSHLDFYADAAWLSAQLSDRWQQAQWNALALAISLPPPNPFEIRDVIEEYRGRADAYAKLLKACA